MVTAPNQYDLDLARVVERINKEHAKRVCIQLPEGLKPRAPDIIKHLEKDTHARIIIWLGSCYGACDVPTQVASLGVDLIVQWGHAEWV